MSAGTVDIINGGLNVNVLGQAATALPAGTDRSGSITAANTSQQVAPANTSRVGLTFQNTSDTNMYLSENGSPASASNGYVIVPNGSVNVSTNKQINVFCTVAGKTFASTEY